jgi:transposase-like protein
MASNEPSRLIGKIDCPVCSEELPVRQNGRDTVNLSCPWCGLSAYAKGGTQAHGIVTGWIRKEEGTQAQQVKPAAPKAPAAPAGNPETIFG